MNIGNHYFHTLLKDNVGDKIYNNFEAILKDGKLKSQGLLNNVETKFNGLDYISLASYVEKSEYKTLVIDKENYKTSGLSKLFESYEEYLAYLKLDEWLEKPKSREEFFRENNTNDKREYYNYLDSISRRYPVDIKYLYEKTSNIIYKYILDMIEDDILYCNKTEYCFEEYIRNSKGITFIFPKEIDVVSIHIIPNLPFDVESKLVKKTESLSTRYSNQIGEVQVKEYINIDKAVGILINDNISKERIFNLLKKYKIDIKLYCLLNDRLIEL